MTKKDKISEICRLIAKKYSFAYKIGETYFLTNGLFVRECDLDEKENLNIYLNQSENNNLKNLDYEEKYDLSKSDIKKFVIPMKILLNKAEQFKEIDGYQKLDEFLNNYSYSELCDLDYQIEIFEKAWFYKERYEIFYDTKTGGSDEKEK